MKKVFPLFFLTIFLFNVAGYYIIFKTEQYQVKNEIESEIRSGVNTAELTTITFSKKDLGIIQWQESGKEMRYNDGLYDVVKSTETASSITYYCINDKKEESLFTSLGEHIDTHVASNMHTKNSKKVFKRYFSNEYAFSFLEHFSIIKFYSPEPVFFRVSYTINSPPPEFS